MSNDCSYLDDIISFLSSKSDYFGKISQSELDTLLSYNYNDNSNISTQITCQQTNYSLYSASRQCYNHSDCSFYQHLTFLVNIGDDDNVNIEREWESIALDNIIGVQNIGFLYCTFLYNLSMIPPMHNMSTLENYDNLLQLFDYKSINTSPFVTVGNTGNNNSILQLIHGKTVYIFEHDSTIVENKNKDNVHDINLNDLTKNRQCLLIQPSYSIRSRRREEQYIGIVSNIPLSEDTAQGFPFEIVKFHAKYH